MRAAALLLVALVSVPGARAEDPPPAAGDAPKAAELPAPRLLGPRTGPERKKALARYGGTDGTEKAVAAGLDWLARHQHEDGSWDADAFDERCAKDGKACDGRGKGQHGEEIPCPFDGPISAFALLAFLGDGHVPGGTLPDGRPDPYATVVERAVARLADEGGWALPVVTEALAELEAMERKGLRRAAVARNVERILGVRDRDGAWGYWGSGSDVPTTALVVPALVAARDAGADLPDDVAPKVDAWLASLEESKGRLGYRIDGRRFGYTPTTSNAHGAFAAREFLGAGLESARHSAHAACVASDPPVWKISFREMDVPGRGKVPVQIGNLSMYQWYYGTVGSFQRGGTAWPSWFGAVKSALGNHQRRDGCARGSWDPLGTYERQTGGRVFATALGVLMLEAPYRHRRIRG